MTKLNLSLRNLVKRALFFNLCFLFIISSCTYSTSPTYLKENISQAIQDICKNEYKIDVSVKLAGETLWVYVPVEDLFVKAETPEKYTEKYEISENKTEFMDNVLNLQYAIKGVDEQKEKMQEVTYNKKIMEKTNNVWKALRRVIFSMESSNNINEPKFFCIVTADIKNGFETRDLFYYLDLKKVSYGFISVEEFQHRTVQETNIDPAIILDIQGKHLNYTEITMKYFIAGQISHRIRLKFQKPEIKENADIDKEIEKIAALTIKIYNFNDFKEAELYNSLTKNRIILNRAAILTKPTEQKS